MANIVFNALTSTPNTDEQAFINILENAGYTVTVVPDGSVAGYNYSNQDLLIIRTASGNSYTSHPEGSSLNSLNVPILSLDRHVSRVSLSMATSSAAGSSTAFTRVTSSPQHPMGEGMDSPVSIYSSELAIARIWSLTTGVNCVWYNGVITEAGIAIRELGKRVHFGAIKASSFTADGEKLFLSTVNYLTREYTYDFFEDFESGNQFNAGSSGWTRSGTHAAAGSFGYGRGSGTSHQSRSYSGETFSAGPDFNYEGWIRLDDGGTNLAGLVFGHTGSGNNGYQVIIDGRNGSGSSAPFQLRLNASTTPLGTSTSPTISNNAWYRITVEWRTSAPRITCRLYNASGSLLATITSNNTNYTSGRLALHAYNAASFDNIHLNEQQVLPKLVTLQDDFSGSSLDTDKWEKYDDASGDSVAVEDGRVKLVRNNDIALLYSKPALTPAYDIRNSSFQAEVDISETQANSQVVFGLYRQSNTYLIFYFGDGTLDILVRDAGSFVYTPSITYSPTNHRWLKIREASGTIYFEASSDGVSWETIGSYAHSLTWLNAVYFRSLISTTGVLYIDNFNVGPPKETLQDNFSGSSLDTDKWTGEGVSVSNGLVLQTTGMSFPYIYSNASYSLKDSYAMAEVVSEHAVSTSNQWFTFMVYSNIQSSTNLSFFIDSSVIKAQKRVSGTLTTVASPAYSAASHRWLRIRETSGTVYWETSANGITWDVMASDATPFSVFATGSYIEASNAFSTGTYTTTVNNFNIESSLDTGAFFQFF